MAFDDDFVEVVGLGGVEWAEREVVDEEQVGAGDPPDFGFDFGFPPRHAYACMSETMALALEGRFEDYTVGKEIGIERASEIGEIATRHGFRLSGFRSFEHAVSEEQIARVREKALANRREWASAII